MIKRLLRYALGVMPILGLSFAMTLSSCQKIDSNDITTNSSTQSKQTRDVQFVMKGLSVDYVTRATLASESITDLWVFEGSTLLKHQVSTDADFGLPTVILSYGAHDLTFVASKSEGQGFTSGWQCTRVKDTYATVLAYTVSKGSTSKQVELKRVNSKVQWTIEDAVPSSVATASVKVGTYYGLSASLAGMGGSTYERTIDMTSTVGNTGVVLSSMVIPAVYGEEGDCEASITFKDAVGDVVAVYTNTVKVKSNRITNVHGTFFGSDAKQTVSLATDWLTTLDVAL